MRPNSIQLTIAEWIEIAESLERKAQNLSRESRNVLNDVVANLESLDADSEIERLPVEATKLSIKRDWHALDEKVTELIGQASDELAQFVTTQEIRVRSLDRRLQRNQGQHDRSDPDHRIDNPNDESNHSAS